MKNTILIRILTSIFSMFLLAHSALSQANDLTDGEIIAIYNQVNSFDIETAYLGQLLGSKESLRELAKMVAKDHTGVRQSVQQLASNNDVIPVLPASRSSAFLSHYETIESLRGLSGDNFDEAYLNHEIEFHTQAMNAVREVLLPATTHPKLKAHFESVLPHFEHHLNETKKVSLQLGFDVCGWSPST